MILPLWSKLYVIAGAMQRPRLAGARFSRHRDPHVSGPRLRKDERMSRAPRLAGYALMTAAALLALAMRRGAVDAIGPFPAVAVALFLGMLEIGRASGRANMCQYV